MCAVEHEYGIDLDKVTWLTIEDAHLAEYTDPSNVRKLPAGARLKEMLFKGEIAAAIMGNDMPDDPRMFVESRGLAGEQPGKVLPPIGLDANRKALEMAIQYAHEQKVIPRRLSVDELFDDTTAALTA